MIKTISAWKISSLNEYSVQIRLGSNLGGFFLFQGEGLSLIHIYVIIIPIPLQYFFVKEADS